jgi:galactose oxidase
MTNVVARHSGQCLTVAQTPADRLPVIQSGCNGDALQQWRFIADNGSYKIGLGTSGFCATVDGAGAGAGANIVLVDCRGSKATRWVLRADNASYVMSPRGTAMCLDVPGASVTDGTTVTQYSCIEGNSNQQWILANPPTLANWSAPITLPLIPVAAANMKDGKLLMWSAYSTLKFEGTDSAPHTETAVYDPTAGIAVSRLVTETYHDMFCPGTSLLPDGRLLVNGGNSSAHTSIFDSDDNNWTQGPPMLIARGYPGNATLSNGDVLTLGGSWSGAEADRNGEVWNEANGWGLRTGIPVAPFIGVDPRGAFRGDNHLWLFAGANGNVFHAGPSPQMNRITTDGAGTVTSAGTRVDDTYSMNGNAVLYQPGKILKVGGAPAYEEAWANAAAYVIGYGDTWQHPRKIAPMNYARAFHNSVVTPTGTVIITGGQTYARPFSDERAVLKPEQWDPLTEVFSVLPAMQTPRTYHSVSILLPDARVFVGGGGLCGVGCPSNHADAEILTPPYLLTASGALAPRPVLSMTDFETTMDGSFSVTSDSPIAYFSLVRLSSVTHSVNNDQRFIKIRAQTDDARNYTLQMPSDAGTTIPGFYMLFGINTKGVPSVAQTVSIR